jgi:hypothetical protein
MALAEKLSTLSLVYGLIFIFPLYSLTINLFGDA